jgi:diamine N-acetyltransferase
MTHPAATLPTIRLATADDAPALSDLATRTAIDTFATENSAEDMAAFVQATYAPDIQARELADPAITYVIMERDRTMLAYAMLRERGSPHVSDPTAIELQRFYVDKSSHGTGLAHRLMADCLERAARRGARSLWLGVWERNARALRFYEKRGFRSVGMQTFTVGTDVQHDHVMVRDVQPQL